MTILWHVDDAKVFHASSKIIDEFIEWIKTTYGSIKKYHD